MAKYKDANPVAGAQKGGGKKNVDGRIDGAKYNKQDKAAFNPEKTYDPNENSKRLPQRPGLEEGAY